MTRFATCLNCIDGRTHEPVISWIKEKYSIDYIDLITEPGMDGLLSKGLADNIIEKATFSIKAHESELIFIAGHHDCLGNPVSDKVHKENIKLALNRLVKYYPHCRIIGLWLSKSQTVEEITLDNN